ncbi:hypothetical protein JG687_00001955 [Phytophthora cactorum]|uniref:Uncharacterized protein n=1 Tax=Phytophthora cactorum TaxID=29920 RepID=A0A8T1UYJ9_9STRA|nr:hypothetical protein JG687_00001955 [Phytophthora cactorum]
MATESSSPSAFAAPSPRLSDDLCCFLDALERNQSANTAVHMRKGRRQLETFLLKQHGGAKTFEQVIEKESLQWGEHVDKANTDKDVRVQQRPVLMELLPGLQLVHDIKVGRPGRPDDAVYLKSQYAREWLPRGNCIAKWKTRETTYFFPLIRGYRKFTGQEDDGELKKQTGDEEEELSKFFTKPQTQSKWVISTTKENGEAGHLAVLKRSDGEFVYVLGSKNTHLIAQTVEDIERTQENQKKEGGNDPFFAAAPIATSILRMLFALEPAKLKLLCEFLWQTRATASFEAALEHSKCAYQHEGGVHLFLDEDAAVIGMQKHKSIWYVCLRAIREKAKTFCRTLNSKKPPKGRAKQLTPKEALTIGKESVKRRFQAIPGFLHISNEIANAYEALGEQFLEYLFEEELFRGVAAGDEEEEKCKQDARDVADLFPVVWKRFLDHTGASDTIEQR